MEILRVLEQRTGGRVRSFIKDGHRSSLNKRDLAAS